MNFHQGRSQISVGHLLVRVYPSLPRSVDVRGTVFVSGLVSPCTMSRCHGPCISVLRTVQGTLRLGGRHAEGTLRNKLVYGHNCGTM